MLHLQCRHFRAQRQEQIQREIESVGRQFLSSLKSRNNYTDIEAADLKHQEDRWHSLWIKSLEFILLIKEYNLCPQHSDPKTVTMTTSVACGMDLLPKDTGYSSDADLSDASNPADKLHSLSLSPVKKRVMRRRTTSKRRPWSFHVPSEWSDWDYYQPPPVNVNAATIEPEDMHDESVVKSLIEFGENYELWFKTDEGIAGLRSSTPIRNEANTAMCIRSSKDRRDIGSETDTGKSSGCCLSDVDSVFSSDGSARCETRVRPTVRPVVPLVDASVQVPPRKEKSNKKPFYCSSLIVFSMILLFVGIISSSGTQWISVSFSTPPPV